ncbi:MAG: urease accessory UreF family protein [Elainellaceae cyanobacterium]
MANSSSLLRLLQLTSPTLPVGAYSYSEGLEALSQQGRLPDAEALDRWLTQELRHGSIRLESSILLKAYRAVGAGNLEAIAFWNQWLSALRETEEMRQQSWQMGQSLQQLLQQLDPDFGQLLPMRPCNFAIAFAVAAAHWSLSPYEAVAGYLHSWINSGISAGIKLIPLGQTAGQQLQQRLYPEIEATAEMVLTASDNWWDWTCDDAIYTPSHSPDEEARTLCSWGLSLASMTHETLYSRLFRS